MTEMSPFQLNQFRAQVTSFHIIPHYNAEITVLVSVIPYIRVNILRSNGQVILVFVLILLHILSEILH